MRLRLCAALLAVLCFPLGAAASAANSPLRVGMTWDSLPSPPEGIDNKFKIAYEALGMDAKFADIQAVTARMQDYDRRWHEWSDQNFHRLGRAAWSKEWNTYQANLEAYRKERQDKLAAITDNVVQYAERSLKFEGAVRAGLDSLLGTKSKPTANPFADPKNRDKLYEGLANLYNAKMVIRKGLEKITGRSIELVMKPSAADVTEATKAKGKDRIDLAFLTGPAAAYAGTDKVLKPLAVGGQSLAQIRDGLQMRLVLSPENPALKKLDGYGDVMGAKDRKWDDRNDSAEAMRAREEHSDKALAGNRDIAGFEKSGQNDERLREDEKTALDELYAKFNARWQRASPDAQKRLYAEYLEDHRKTKKYYKDLIDRGVLSLTDNGMRKLLEGLRCQPLALNDQTRPHVLQSLQQQLAHFGLKGDGFFAERKMGEDDHAFDMVGRSRKEDPPENDSTVTVADASVISLEQSRRPGNYKYNLLVVKNKDFNPVVPAAALWYDPDQMDSATAAKLQAAFAATSRKKMPLDAVFMARATGVAMFAAPPKGYLAQIAGLRDKFPAPPAGRLQAKSDCGGAAGPAPGGTPHKDHD